MSNMTLFQSGSVIPDYLREAVDSTTKDIAGSSGGKQISIKGGVWRMMVNGKEIAKNEDRSMNVVIVAAAPKVSRTFYLKQYSEGSEPVAPDCWSADGDVPDAKASMPQSKRCVDCEKNLAGSGQGNSRACRFSQRIAVVLANDLHGDVFQLTLPAASVFGTGEPGKWPLQTYAKMIGAKGVPVTAVVTEMRFDTDSATPKLTFKPIKVLDPADHKIVIEQGKSDSAIKAITMTVAEVDGAKQIAAPVPKPKAETIVEPIPEPIPEPTKRSAKKEEEPEAKKDLSKILDEWDD